MPQATALVAKNAEEEVLEDRENEFISWASLEGADVENSGFIRFKKAPHGYHIFQQKEDNCIKVVLKP